MKTIEITIPILNEEATLLGQVGKAIDFIGENLQGVGGVTLVLADNGSTDKTPEIAQVLAAGSPYIEYLRLDQRGVGRALKMSWGRSHADVVGYMDLDLATDLGHLRPALEAILSKEADIVTGSRLAKGAKVIGRKPLRGFTSLCFNAMLKLIFKTSFSDGMCGFKFLKRSLLEEVLATGARSDGWFFATEILIVGEYLDYKVTDLPVVWTDDPSSKVSVAKLAMEYLRAMMVLRKRLNRI
jgi:glycosyltransferase involved in cell wall biosynthesis